MCKCSAAVGSVWTTDKPPRKTGEYRNPATMVAAAKPTAETKSQPAMAVQPIIHAPLYRIECRNGVCRKIRIN